MSNSNSDEPNIISDDKNNEKSSSNNNNTTKTIVPEPLTNILPPQDHYFLDQMKNGILISNKKINQNRLIFGRARDCDIPMDHPSISRYHAALLWAPKNDQDFQNGKNKESFWYLIDCGSTHGTICNKQQVEPGKMIKITPNNNLFKFGASTRLFTLGSNEQPEEDSDDDSNNVQIQKRTLEVYENEDQDVCTWGMSLTDCNDEQSEETGDSMALKSIVAAMKDGKSSLERSENENAFADNPYKCLQQWFEREGYDFDYKIEQQQQQSSNKFKCKFELPIDGQWIPVEGQLMNRKKDAINDACLCCCKLLDQAQLLFTWQRKESAREKAHKEYYDNDDGDDLIDETVKISKKKFKKSNPDDNNVDNYETLNDKWKQINNELCQLKVRLATIGLKPDVTPEIPKDLVDSLDLFYATMNQKKYGLTMNEKIEKSNLKMKIKNLEQEQTRIEKLINIARPVDIVLKQQISTQEESQNITETKNQDSDKSKIEETEPDPEPEPKEPEKSPELKPKSTKEYKEIRKMKQESIIEAIEKEKQLEKQLKKQQQQQQQQQQQDEDFIDWIPPMGQSGDGRTHLNDKFGY